MIASQTACVADAAITHPYWCDPRRCSNLHSGPGLPPGAMHVGPLETVTTCDARIEMYLLRADEPEDLGGLKGQPLLSLSSTSLPASIPDNESLFTVAEATTLITALQTMVDAMRERMEVNGK